MSREPVDAAMSGNVRNTSPIPTRIWPWTLVGLVIVALLVGGVGSWAGTARLASAIVAQGEVTVDTNRKRIQHLEGGIVSKLHVRDGDTVAAGQIVIQLDDTRARATLAIIETSYMEELAKEARYIAERDGSETISWPNSLQAVSHRPEVAQLLASQSAIFRSRRDTLMGEIAILNERIAQLERQSEGFDAQRKANVKQLAFIREELTSLETLFEKGQTTKPRILALKRSAASLEGDWGSLTARIAGAAKSIGETRLEILQKRKAFRTEVVTTLREIQSKLADLRERQVASADVLKRLDIRAPVSGKVVGLAVHAKDAVIRPGDTIMEIVPDDDRLILEVKVQPRDIDNVALKQPAEVQLTGFNRRTTPTLKGHVSYMSADSLRGARDAEKFYVVRISVLDSELARLGAHELQPGMPAEVLIKTGERTAAEYLLQPIIDSMNRAWREN